MQPCNSRTLIEELTYSELPMQSAHHPVWSPPREELAARSWFKGRGGRGAQIYAESAVAQARSGEKQQASEKSIEQIDSKTPGWTRRVRIGAVGPGRAPCPDRMTTLEKSVRLFAESQGDNVIVSKLGLSFDTLGKAYDFYNLYSWEKGFGIRYGKSRLNVNRTKCMQEIVCGCAV